MSTVNKELKQTRKNIKTAAKIFNIVKIITLTFAVITAVIGLAILVASSKLDPLIADYLVTHDGQLLFKLDILNLSYDFTHELADGRYSVLLSGYAIGWAFIASIAGLIFDYIYKIFKSMFESESPFTFEILSKIRKCFIGIVVLVCLTEGLLMGAFIGIVEWSIYSILKYGCALQQESDEIL